MCYFNALNRYVLFQRAKPNYCMRYFQEEVNTFHKGENKRLLALPTLEGLVFTTKNYVRLAKYLLQNGAVKVHFKTFSQDVLEAFFGNVVRAFSIRTIETHITLQ